MFCHRYTSQRCRARDVCERSNRRDDAVVRLGREASQVFLRTAFEQDAIHGHLRLRSARYSSSGR